MSKIEHIGEVHAGISDIHLYTGPNGTHLEVKTAGIWYEVIYESKDHQFDHFVTAEGMRQLYLEEKAIQDFTHSEDKV